MFFIKLFYNTKDIHKLLIQHSYNDFNSEIKIFNTKYPNFKGYVIGDEHDKLTEETKKDWNEYREKVNKLQTILINNLLYYCKNYPMEKISKNRFINEYEEYPYRLEQNIDYVLSDL